MKKARVPSVEAVLARLKNAEDTEAQQRVGWGHRSSEPKAPPEMTKIWTGENY